MEQVESKIVNVCLQLSCAADGSSRLAYAYAYAVSAHMGLALNALAIDKLDRQ